MAILTQRNDIKPMFGSIAWMVVMFCLFSALTSLSFDIWQFPCQYSAAHFQSGFILVSLLICLTPCYAFYAVMISITPFSTGFSAFFRCTIKLLVTLLGNFTYITLRVFYLTFSAFIRNIVFVATIFTPRPKTSWSVFSWIKLRNVFDLLAFTTGFGYDGFRHFCFSIKQLCLRLRQVHPCLCLSIISPQTNLSTSILGGNFQWQ